MPLFLRCAPRRGPNVRRGHNSGTVITTRRLRALLRQDLIILRQRTTVRVINSSYVRVTRQGVTLLDHLRSTSTPVRVYQGTVIGIVVSLTNSVHTNVGQLVASRRPPLRQTPIRLLKEQGATVTRRPSLIIRSVNVSVGRT